MRHCSVPECKSRGGRMFWFPRNPHVRNLWKNACKIGKEITENMNVCKRHFNDEDVVLTPGGRNRVRKGAVPTLNLPKDFIPVRKGRKCVVPGCLKRPDDGVTFHRFPQDIDRRRTWKICCCLPKFPGTNVRICSDHFTKDDFEYLGHSKKLKIRCVVPSRNLPGSPVCKYDVDDDSYDSDSLILASEESDKSHDSSDREHEPQVTFENDPLSFSKTHCKYIHSNHDDSCSSSFKAEMEEIEKSPKDRWFLDDASQPAHENEDNIEDNISTKVHLMDEVSQNLVQDTKIEPSESFATSTWNENSQEMTERTNSSIPAPYYCSVNERKENGNVEEFSEQFRQNSLSNEVISEEDENVNRSHLQDDRFDAFAKIVAIKLRSLPKRQMLIAEKLINETLFEGELGNLTLYHRLVA